MTPLLRGQEWIEVAAKLEEIKKMKKFYEKSEEELVKMLMTLSESKDSYGHKYKFYAIERRGSIEYKLIPELRGVNLDKYRSPSTLSWRLETNYVHVDIKNTEIPNYYGNLEEIYE